MHPSKLIVAAALAAATLPVMAQPETRVDTVSGVGATRTTGTVKATATVVAIDAATRTISLKNKQGKVTDVQVGEDVRNFEQLRVGDMYCARKIVFDAFGQTNCFGECRFDKRSGCDGAR